MSDIKQKAKSAFLEQFFLGNHNLTQEVADWWQEKLDLAIAEERKRLLEGLLVDMSALTMFNADDMAYVHKIIKNRFN